MLLTLPSELFLSISDLEGGRLVLVVGAGTSYEAPTSIPLSPEFSQTVHDRLVADGVLDEACMNPTDLSEVADSVSARERSLQELVDRVDRARLVSAEPNEGHRLATAMMREGAIVNILTLNYDLAISNALSLIGDGAVVQTITRPSDHRHLGKQNLIYLHGNASCEPDEWIMRSEDLDVAWENGWREVIAQIALASPAIAFIGLGTPTRLLLETSRRIRRALNELQDIYYVSPDNPEKSEFFLRLGLPDDAAIPMTWNEFMNSLSQRLVVEHRNELERYCKALVAEQSLDEEDSEAICEKLARLGLLSMGRVRARWLLQPSQYTSRDPTRQAWLAHCVLIIALIERIGDCQANFRGDGIVEFRDGTRIIANLLVAHGKGIDNWATLQDKIRRSEDGWDFMSPRPVHAVVIGPSGGKDLTTAAPGDIVGETQEYSLLTGRDEIELILAEDLRNNPNLVEKVLGR